MEKRLQLGSFIGIVGHSIDTFYLTQAAQQMGYYVDIYNPFSENRAGYQADIHTIGSYSDIEKLQAFAENVDTLLYTTKDLSNDVVRALGAEVYLPQGDDMLTLAQDKVLQKVFLESIGVTTLPYATVLSKEDILESAKKIGFPCVLKRNLVSDHNPEWQVFYDVSEIEAFDDSALLGTYILEEYLEEQTGITVVLAVDEEDMVHPVTLSQTVYQEGKLQTSFNPPKIKEEVALETFQMGLKIAKNMSFVGVVAIDFLVDGNEHLIVNDLHPFPSGSARYTLSATNVSQYDAFIRVSTGIPMGQIYHYKPAAALMVHADEAEKAQNFFEKHPQGMIHQYTYQLHETTEEEADTDARAHLTYIANDRDELTTLLDEWTN